MDATLQVGIQNGISPHLDHVHVLEAGLFAFGGGFALGPQI